MRYATGIITDGGKRGSQLQDVAFGMPRVSSRVVAGKGLREVSLRTKLTTASKEISLCTIVCVNDDISPGDGHIAKISSARRTPVC